MNKRLSVLHLRLYCSLFVGYSFVNLCNTTVCRLFPINETDLIKGPASIHICCCSAKDCNNISRIVFPGPLMTSTHSYVSSEVSIIIITPSVDVKPIPGNS